MAVAGTLPQILDAFFFFLLSPPRCIIFHVHCQYLNVKAVGADQADAPPGITGQQQTHADGLLSAESGLGGGGMMD